MAPQDDQEQAPQAPRRTVRIGSYTRKATKLLDRTLAQHGLTEASDDDGVSMLDVCAFQSSV